eukprot:3719885-Pyramimonas_sp.AAC.1
MVPPDVADKCNHLANYAATIRTLYDTPLHIIITEEETKRQFTQAKEGRGGGPDNLLDEYCKIAPDEMTIIDHPLLGRAQLATVGPISRRGGWQASFSKPNATKPDLQAGLMILLINIIAMHHHRFLRTRLKSITAQLSRGAQCGARPHQSTDFVTHATLGVMDYLRERELPRAPEELHDLLRDINILEPFLPALQMAMEGAPIFNHNVGDEHLCALLQDARADMWATTKDLP